MSIIVLDCCNIQVPTFLHLMVVQSNPFGCRLNTAYCNYSFPKSVKKVAHWCISRQAKYSKCIFHHISSAGFKSHLEGDRWKLWGVAITAAAVSPPGERGGGGKPDNSARAAPGDNGNGTELRKFLMASWSDWVSVSRPCVGVSPPVPPTRSARRGAAVFLLIGSSCSFISRHNL